LNTSDKKINLFLDELLELHPKRIDLSLDRIKNLLSKINNPQNKIENIIHVGGTNGKFSTLKFIQAILKANAKSTNAYISPHLVRFNERFELNDKIINNDELYEALNKIRNTNISATFFELITAAFFELASKHSVDYNLIEVGLFGRMDSSNLKNPLITVITSISKDHIEFLPKNSPFSKTVESIAWEKAGIIKKHVPVVIGYQPFEEAKKVIIDYAHSVEAPTWIYGQDFFVTVEGDKIIYEDNDYRIKFDNFNNYSKFQVKNLGLAIATSLQLYNIDVKPFLENNLHQHVYFPGRFEKLKEGKLLSLINKDNELYLDGSHNSDAAHNINQSLISMPQKDLCIIIGMLNSKDPHSYVKEFSNVKLIKTIEIPREENSLSSSELKDKLFTLHNNISEEDSIEAAIKSIVRSHPDARILICGSLYLAGQVLKLN